MFAKILLFDLLYSTDLERAHVIQNVHRQLPVSAYSTPLPKTSWQLSAAELNGLTTFDSGARKPSQMI